MHIGSFNRLLIGVASAYLAALPAWAAEPVVKKKPPVAAKPASVPVAPAAPAAPAQDKPSGVLPVNPVAVYAQKNGVKRCVDRLNEFSNFVTRGGKSGAFVFLAPKEPDGGLVSVSMEVVMPDLVSYTDVTATPKWNGCGGEYEAIVYWPYDCKEVAGNKFADLKPAGVLKQAIQMFEGPGTMRVFLMPAGGGCVSIKKEVVY